MNKKLNNSIRKFLYGIILAGLILALCLGSSGAPAARAQGQPPPQPTQPPRPPSYPSAFPPGVDGQKTSNSPSGQTKADANPASIALGAPGLSFRYLQMFGSTEEPYIADTTHLNRPEGLFMDGSNNLYVTESQGERLLRYDSSKTNTLSIGKAGVSYTDDYVFSNITDSALDGDGNIWVVDGSRVVQYDTNGNILQSLPAQDDNPWQTGNTNSRFDNARGIAFGTDGRMFVSDSNNNRVQVFTMGTGSPVYDTTIGTGSSGDGNTFNAPNRIAVFGNKDLYVVDTGNNQAQHCVFSNAWSCSTLDSGLNSPQGITVDGSQNVFIADTNNNRIRKCNSSEVCSDFVTNTYGPSDLALDSSGNVYSATSWYATVVRYDKTGIFLGIFLGVDQVPYLTDGYHYNHPRVAIDSSNNIIIVEENGQRLIKLNSSGVSQWSRGVPGLEKNDNTHFNWPHGVAVDGAGNIYVADGFRVQMYNGSGTYLYTLGSEDDGSHGNTMFGWAAGIAVDNTGTIYVSDCKNNRVQIFNSSRTFVATLAPSGSSDGQLNCPIGLAVDSTRNVYVVDAGNNRVQKFNSSRVWQMSIGVPGPWGSGSADFAHFGSGPEDITVDTQGRIYVADINNQRVQVFTSSGSYLTTIGGAWGANTSQFRGTSGVDVDSLGNVYVSDLGNARIQKFAPGVPGWLQANLNGFGDVNSWGIQRMAVSGGYLYASVYNDVAGGALWRTTDGSNWSKVSLDGFGNPSNTSMLVEQVFNGKMYVGTANPDTGGEIWRCTVCDGSDWTQVVSGGFGDNHNYMVERIVVFSNTLYATTDNHATGAEVWTSPTGNGGSWTQSNLDGFGKSENTGLWATDVFNGYLYAATAQWDAYSGDTQTGLQVWRTDGSAWNQVNLDGFGDKNNMSPWLDSFNGYMYLITFNYATGTQIWRCSTCAGSDWEPVVSNGFGDINNSGVLIFPGVEGSFYAVTDNPITGGQIWRTTNGTEWRPVNIDGLGDSNNMYFWSGTVFEGSLFLGTANQANGGEIWRLLHQVFLPLVMR